MLSPLDGFSSPFGARKGFSPKRLFTDNGTGVVWDFSSTAGLFTDSAGTTPLTTPTQTVGLVRDGSRVRPLVTDYGGAQANAGLRPEWLQSGYGYINPDRSDDTLSTVLTLAQTGDVMIFGRNGSWIETGRVYGAGSTFSIGASGGVGPAASQVTGFTTLNILRALGGIVGIVAIGRTLTAAEQTLLMNYFQARGAAGLLAVSGAELVTNGDAASGTTGWTAFNGTITNVSNQFVLTASAAFPGVHTNFATVIGQPYLLSMQLVADGMTGNQLLDVGNSPGASAVMRVTMASVATYTATFVATGTTTYVTHAGGASAVAAQTATFDNVTCKLLVAA